MLSWSLPPGYNRWLEYVILHFFLFYFNFFDISSTRYCKGYFSTLMHSFLQGWRGKMSIALHPESCITTVGLLWFIGLGGGGACSGIHKMWLRLTLNRWEGGYKSQFIRLAAPKMQRCMRVYDSNPDWKIQGIEIYRNIFRSCLKSCHMQPEQLNLHEMNNKQNKLQQML